MGLFDELSAIAGKVSDTAVKVAGDYRTITGADGTKIPQTGAPALPAAQERETGTDDEMQRVRPAGTDQVNGLVQWAKDHVILAGLAALAALGLVYLAVKKLFK